MSLCNSKLHSTLHPARGRHKRVLPAARYEYIKELDKQRGRGQQGAKSPLLWDAGQVEELLQGSPVAKEVGLRLKVGGTLPNNRMSCQDTSRG